MDIIRQHGLFLGLAAVFLAGLALNLTPCVYPMIPVTLAFFSNQSAGSRARVARLAALYVLGISLSNALLGIVAARTGELLGAWLQQPGVLLIIAAVIVLLSLSMFGLYDVTVPAVIARRLGRASTGAAGAFTMGLLVGVVAAPCIGPFVAGLMLFVGQMANPGVGFLLFFVLGLGMGLPYLVLGIAAHRVSRLPKAGAWLSWSKKLLGVGLLGLALYFLKPLISERLLWLTAAALLAGAGVGLGWLDRSAGRRSRLFWVQRIVGSALVIAAVLMVWPRPQPGPAVAWQPYTEAGFESAQREGRPIVIDVYADWCLPCVEMDHVTFRHPDVVRALSSVTTLRLDVTSDVSKDGEGLIDRYDIFGAPTTLFFDARGKEHKALRLLGFAGPEEFLERLQQIL